MAKQLYAKPALLVAHTRSGGTMLNYALSTHRRVFWVRGEPLLRQMEWATAFPGAADSQILDCITRASFYTVAGCKVTYEQLQPPVWEWIRENQPRVLHLVRKNWVRVALSQMITGMVASQKLKGHHAHSFQSLESPQIHVNPAKVVHRATRQRKAMHRMIKLLEKAGVEILDLTYKQITGGYTEIARIPQSVGEQICDFLGVRYEHLTCDLRRVNKAPLSEIVENWDDFKRVILASEFRHCLKGEMDGI